MLIILNSSCSFWKLQVLWYSWRKGCVYEELAGGKTRKDSNHYILNGLNSMPASICTVGRTFCKKRSPNNKIVQMSCY